jgi:hypothetical protein
VVWLAGEGWLALKNENSMGILPDENDYYLMHINFE